MVQENTHNETEIRRFLLGEMSADVRSAFEAKFRGGRKFIRANQRRGRRIDRILLRETLSSAEKINFEREFLSTEPRRRRVAFTRTMLDKLHEQNKIAVAKKTETVDGNPSVWDSIIEFFKTPTLAFGAAFALLVLIFGGWFLLRNPNQPEIAKQITPTATAEIIEPIQNQNSTTNQNDSGDLNTNTAENIPDNKTDSPNTNRATPNKNQNSNIAKQTSDPTTPMLALFAGGVRSRRQNARIKITEKRSGRESAIKSRKRGLQNLSGRNR